VVKSAVLPQSKTSNHVTGEEQDPYFGEDADFVCVFQMGGLYVCKHYDDLEDNEWKTMMASDRWCHFLVKRDRQGRATVKHASTTTIKGRDGFKMTAKEARGLTDTEIVRISQEKYIQPPNLLAQLKDDYEKGHRSWNRRQLQAKFGNYAVAFWLRRGYLVKTGAMVALAHLFEGTLAHLVYTFTEGDLLSMAEYKAAFPS